jgi:DNA-directed RNA polymerase subunit RPC12/RpoP
MTNYKCKNCGHEKDMDSTRPMIGCPLCHGRMFPTKKEVK